MIDNRPANVPQQHANQAMHAPYAVHARAFFVSGFVSVENKGSKIQIPKLDVAGSIPVARSRFCVAATVRLQNPEIQNRRT